MALPLVQLRTIAPPLIPFRKEGPNIWCTFIEFFPEVLTELIPDLVICFEPLIPIKPLLNKRQNVFPG